MISYQEPDGSRPTAARDAADGGERLPTVDSMSRLIGSELVSLVEAADVGHRCVSGSVLYDPNAQPTPFPGAVALGIGLSLSGKRLKPRLEELEKAGYVGLVYKANGDSDELLRNTARAAGLALFRASDSAPWNQVAEIIDAAIAPHRASGRTLVDIRPGDLFDLANTVAALAGGAIAIADPEQTILAYSTLPDQPIDDTRRNSILRLHVPQTEQNDVDYRRVHAASDVIDVVTEEPGLRRCAVAIRAGDTVLGSLWLLTAAESIGADTARVMREAANVAALHLLHRRTAYVSNLTRQVDLVKPLLFEPEQAEVAALKLGISAASVRIAAVSSWPPQPGALETLQSRLRLFDVVRTACAVRLPAAVCGLADNIVYIVLPQTADFSPRFHHDAILRVVQNAARLLSRPVVAGIGRSAPLGRLEQSRTGAEVVLGELFRDLDEGRITPDSSGVVADQESLGSRLHLRQIVMELQKAGHLPGDHAMAIAEYDAAHKTSFEESLRTYLDAGGNAIEVAKQLGLHVNTVRYRLSRIKPLFGIDLDDAETRLLVWLQLWGRHN
ncbi:helix-turn-helix domain-containing protein [Paenarthrobacter sp. DKR-5]|uniref:PucR family transcriptional regulator n=1 Tax=Paenarthrobacter sp. DKR-5 TaxID=2835535 RepID=UPI001BDD84EB|nr:helix-turn-helix domain-containing protein [Paenarthrobacter sp. DKR-5]MBT1004043.1 helix-turn-helix domain-containing protein [Paenarthrobacter sp. DKR-5]